MIRALRYANTVGTASISSEAHETPGLRFPRMLSVSPVIEYNLHCDSKVTLARIR